MSATITDALRWWARTRPTDPAIITRDDSVSFEQFEQWARGAAHELIRQGVRPGDPVVVLGPNCLAWTVAALGVLKAGAVLVPLNSRLSANEVVQTCIEVGARAVVLHPSVAERVRPSDDTAVIVFDTVLDLRGRTFPDVTADGRRDADDPAIVLFTSGSTGRQKGVIFTHRRMLSVFFEWSLVEKPLGPGVRILLVLPLAFAPGVVWGLMMCTGLGGTLILEPEFDPAGALTAISRHGAHVLWGAPLIFERIAAEPGFESADLTSLQTVHTGGARVSTALLQKWQGKGVVIRQIYGMTEAGGSATAASAEDALDHPDTCGTGGPFTTIRVVREDGTTCDPGEEGQITLQSPGITPGYWNEPELTAEVLRDGWLYSGDIGIVDEQGRLRFVDRMKDIIISGGINISPIQLEDVISRVPGVEEVCVLAAEDTRFGETPAAVVKFAGKPDVEGLIAACNNELADFKVPRYVIVRDEPLPRLPSGKIAKAAVRAEYRDIPGHYSRVR